MVIFFIITLTCRPYSCQEPNSSNQYQIQSVVRMKCGGLVTEEAVESRRATVLPNFMESKSKLSKWKPAADSVYIILEKKMEEQITISQVILLPPMRIHDVRIVNMSYSFRNVSSSSEETCFTRLSLLLCKNQSDTEDGLSLKPSHCKIQKMLTEILFFKIIKNGDVAKADHWPSMNRPVWSPRVWALRLQK